jgi:hypothetical protein
MYMYVYEIIIVGYIHVEDQTASLVEAGYWASYNIPYYEDIATQSGNLAACERSEAFCHDSAPRANLFR